MTAALVAGALRVAALNAIVGSDGRMALVPAGSRAASRGCAAFWLLLRVGQGSALAFAVAVGSLAAAGHYPCEHLFYLYALLPLAVAFVAEQLRVASAQTILDQRGLEGRPRRWARCPSTSSRRWSPQIVRREIGVMALSALVVVFLRLRAPQGTAHGF